MRSSQNKLLKEIGLYKPYMSNLLVCSSDLVSEFQLEPGTNINELRKKEREKLSQTGIPELLTLLYVVSC